MALRRFELKMQGATPLLMHSTALMFGEYDKGRDPLAWEREHLMDFTYRAESGALIVPMAAIRKCLVNACRFVTDKPKARMHSFAPLVEAAVIVEADAQLDVSPDKIMPYISIVGLNPSKGERGPRGPRCRPLVPMPWSAATTLMLADDGIGDVHVEKIADVAGRLVGVLDGRKIGFGRFEATVRKLA